MAKFEVSVSISAYKQMVIEAEYEWEASDIAVEQFFDALDSGYIGNVEVECVEEIR